MTMGKSFQYALAIIALALLASIILMPLSFMMSLANIPQLSAQSIKGSIWSGHALDLKYKNIPFGNAFINTSFLSIVSTSPKLHIFRPSSPDAPAINAVIGASYVDQLTAEIDGKSILSPLPVDIITFEDIAAHFSEGRCDSASGQINMSLKINISGQYISRDISGPLQCVSGSLQSTLKSKTNSEILKITIDDKGAFNANISILGNYPMTAQLSDIGFKPIENGIIMAVSGTL